jgi:hypothetical protein
MPPARVQPTTSCSDPGQDDRFPRNRVAADNSRLDATILFATGFLALLAGSFWGLPSGKSIAGALVILDGGVPYRDFWTMYAPGQFYAVAALYGLFGRELLVQAAAAAVVRASSAVAFLFLLRRLGASRGAAFGLSVAFVLMFWTTAPELTDYPLALPFLLLGLDRVVRYYAGHGVRHLGLAGLLTGVAAWFKHDVAAYVVAGITMSLVTSWLIVGDRRPDAWVSRLTAIRVLAIRALAAALPVAAWTAWSGGVDAWNDLIVFPATVFSKVRHDAFPPLVPDPGPIVNWLADVTHIRNALRASESLSTWITLYAPLAVFVAGLGVLLLARRRLDAARIGHSTLFLACMPFFWAAAHVQQNTHPYTLAILSAGVGTVIWSRPGRTRWRERSSIAVVSVYVAALGSTAAIDAAAVYYEWPGSRILDLAGMRGIRVPARLYRSIQPIGEFFRTYTSEGEPIYAGLARHDSIVINNVLLYAVAGRPACCAFTELHPGVADRAPVQQSIVRRLEEHRVRAMALWEFGWPDEVMDARKQRTVAAVPDAGATILDRYIADRFEIVETHGEYHLLWRRGTPRPTRVSTGSE